MDAATITIKGAGFDLTPGNNTVQFSSGGMGTVFIATATQLTIDNLTGLVVGPLTAIVTTNGQSNAAVQVATLVPAITPDSTSLPPSTTTLILNGVGFSNTLSANIVTLSGGAIAVVSAASPTQLTLTVSRLTAGVLKASVKVGTFTSATVEVAVIS
jgi:hypothetical protein